MRKLNFLAMVVAAVIGGSTIEAGMLVNASLKNGDFGSGAYAGTGYGSYVSNGQGTSFLPTQSNQQSTGLVNFQLGPSAHHGFRSQGTVSFDLYADRQSFVGGRLVEDNYGYDQFHGGQATFGIGASRIANGAGTADDTLRIGWATWHNNVWYSHGTVDLDLDRWHDIGFTWGGTNGFEIWVDGILRTNDSRNLGSWGSNYLGRGSAYNFGLGDNHERGYLGGYHGVSNMILANASIWNEAAANGDTSGFNAVPEPNSLVVFGLACVAGAGVAVRRRQRQHAG